MFFLCTKIVSVLCQFSTPKTIIIPSRVFIISAFWVLSLLRIKYRTGIILIIHLIHERKCKYVIHPLPIGIDNFQEIIENGYYYVDKTLFIKELLDMRGKVNLFTRPRRFGKSLNMSMIQCFFEKSYCNAEKLFQCLAIMETGQTYTRHMSMYPVINISLKSMKQSTFDLSYIQMKKTIAEEFRRHDNILDSEHLTDMEKTRFIKIRDMTQIIWMH